MKREIELIRSARKTLSIEITADAKVIVRAPKRLPVSEINRFLGEKSDWIDKHIIRMKERQKESENSSAQPLSPQDIRLLATRARRIIPSRVRFYAQQMGVTYNGITIRMQKTRWGSCSSKGNLNFNCLLMRTPDEIIDYVVVHELCHLKEMNHSARFWAEVEKVLPDYKERRKWLKDHESEIMYDSL